MHKIKSPNQAEQQGNLVQQKAINNTGQQNNFNHPSPIQTKQSGKPPIQTKQGRKEPYQAKQRPVQRKKDNGLKTAMGNQYGVDLSGYSEHKDSSFPGTVGALATIQGKDIHYAPGQFTEKNRKHELGHAIDNTLNGTPKGDTTIQGHSIDTTREAAADKIMNAPLQMKTSSEAVASESARSDNNAPIQRMVIYPGEIDQMDKVISADVAQQHKKAGGELLTWKEITKAQDASLEIAKGEPIIIAAHGDKGSIEDVQAEVIATMLQAKIKNIEEAGYIYYSACHSAENQGAKEESSVMDITAKIIKNVAVFGSPGLKVNDFDKNSGDEQSFIPSKASRRWGHVQLNLANMFVFDLSDSQGFDSIKDAKELGDQLLGDQNFLKFFNYFTGVLSGKAEVIDDLLKLIDETQKSIQSGKLNDPAQHWAKGLKSRGDDRDLVTIAKGKIPQKLERLKQLSLEYKEESIMFSGIKGIDAKGQKFITNYADMDKHAAAKLDV